MSHCGFMECINRDRELSELRIRVADLKAALGDDAGWFDRAKQAESSLEKMGNEWARERAASDARVYALNDRIRALEARLARAERVVAAARQLLDCIALDKEPRDCECIDGLRAALAPPDAICVCGHPKSRHDGYCDHDECQGNAPGDGCECSEFNVRAALASTPQEREPLEPDCICGHPRLRHRGYEDHDECADCAGRDEPCCHYEPKEPRHE